MRGPMEKPKNRVENPGKLLKRLMDYIFRDYKFHCIIAVSYTHLTLPTT